MADAILPVAKGKRTSGRSDVDHEDEQHRVGLLEAQRLLGVHRGQRDHDRDARLVAGSAGQQPREIAVAPRVLPGVGQRTVRDQEAFEARGVEDVVAGEVRSLAQRSAAAAKEIKDLITDSVGRVEQGSALVDKAGATMNEVVDSVRRVTDIMGEISSASTEQSQGVAQVGEAVTQMDQATQQNAALVEESAAAAVSLKMQAQQLVKAAMPRGRVQ